MDDYHTGIAFLISLGAAVGFINGLLGIAGAATFVSALLIGLPHFFGIDGPDVAKIALASAVGLILPMAIATTQTNASRGTVDWWRLAWFTPSVLAGAFVASVFVFALSAKLMMIILAVAVLITAWRMLAAKAEHLPDTLTPQRPGRSPGAAFSGGRRVRFWSWAPLSSPCRSCHGACLSIGAQN